MIVAGDRDQAVNAGNRENAENGGGAQDEQQLAVRGLCPHVAFRLRVPDSNTAKSPAARLGCVTGS